MGKWATLSGQVVVHKDKHLSLNKLVEDFLQGEDYSFYASPLGNKYHLEEYYYKVELSVEVEGYLAWMMFSDLQKVLVEQGCECDLRARIDL